MRPYFFEAIDSLLAIGAVIKAKVGQAGSMILRVRGDSDGDDDDNPTDESEATDAEEIDAEVWAGTGAMLTRAASPNDDGHAEALFMRNGDTREVIGWRDLRWQLEHDLEKGDTVLRWLGETGGDGQPTVRPRLHLHADGSIDLYADVVRIAKDDGTRLHVDRTNDAITGVAATTTLGKDASHKLEIDGDGDTLTAQAGSTKLALDGDADQADLVAATVNLTSATPTDAMALASKVNDRVDSIARALDAYCGAIPVPNDGGAAIQTVVKALWGGSMPGVPTAPSNVGSTKIKGE